MEEYPEEIREFPRPIVALIRCPQEVYSSLQRLLPAKKQLNGKEVCSYHMLYDSDLHIRSIPKKERRSFYEGLGNCFFEFEILL